MITRRTVRRGSGGRVRIAYIAPHLQIGGSQRQLLELLKGLDRDCYDPTVIAFSSGGTGFLKPVEESGTPVVMLHKRQGLDPLLLPRLVSLLRREPFDIVHSTQTAGNRYGMLAALLARVPHRVASERYFFPWERATRFHAGLDFLVGRVAHHVIANSDFMCRECEESLGIPPEKIEKIPNGYHLERYTSVAGFDDLEGVPTFAIVASLSPVKNHRMLFRAVQVVRRRGIDLKLLVVGDGLLRRPLEDLAGELGLNGTVSFFGARLDTLPMVSAAMATVVTSTTESLCNAAIESMLAGRPVIATDVGGNPEVIEDGRTGFLVPGDDHEALANRMVQLLEDSALARSMGRAAREAAARAYPADAMVRRTEALYERMMSSE